MYQLPPSRSKQPENQFRFQIGESPYSIPKMKFIKPEIALSMSGKDSEEGVKALFAEYAPGALKQIEDSEQLGALFEAWKVESEASPASEITLGESQASATS